MKGKVLYIATPPYDLNPKSYNVQGIGLGRAFCRQGYDFDCIRFKKKNPHAWTVYEYKDVKLKYIEKRRMRILRWGICPELCSREYLDRYDLIIVREYYQIMSYLVSKNSEDVYLYSGHYQNPFFTKAFSNVYDAVFTKRISSLVNATFTKSSLAKQFLENKGYTNVWDIGVGLDTDRFDSKIDIEQQTENIVRYMKSNDCLLFVGTLSEVKNYKFLLNIYKSMQKERPNLKLVTIGKSKQTMFKKLLGKSDKSYAENIQNNFPKEVLNGIFHIESIPNPQLKFVYPLAKAFLLPSRSEIFGMVLLEAMYLGAPVVTSVHGGSVSLIPDNSYGQVVPGFSLNDWKRAINNYLDNPEYADKVRINARNNIVRNYTWDAIAEKMLSVIHITDLDKQ